MGQAGSSPFHPLPIHHSVENRMEESSPSFPEEDFTSYLAEECLALIFQKLPGEDRNCCSLVCKRWYKIESKSRQRLVLKARAELSDKLKDIVMRFEHVTVVALKCSRKLLSIDDKALFLIGKSLRQLKKIKLKGCIQITDEGLHSFSLVCGPLKKFSCGSCGFGARGLNSILDNCSELEDLTVKRLRKVDSQTERIGPGQVKLLRLCLKDLHHGQLFAPLLCGSKHLRTLILSRNAGQWDQMLENMTGNLRELTEMQIESMQMGDRGLMAVSRCFKLEVFYMSKVSECTDVGISAVANGCRKLRKVHLDSWKFRRIADDGLISIANKCPQLQEIVLMGIDATVESLNSLASNCHMLERMALCNTDAVGDLEMSCIAAKFIALKKLCIKNCQISDDGLEAIANGCPNLVKLKVKRCKGVTSKSISWLLTNRASVMVSVDCGSQTPAEDEQVGHFQTGNDRFIRGSTHVLCGSRAPFMKTKLGMATSNFLRRSVSANQSQV